MFQTTEHKISTTYDLVSIFSHHFLGDNFAKKDSDLRFCSQIHKNLLLKVPQIQRSYGLVKYSE